MIRGNSKSESTLLKPKIRVGIDPGKNGGVFIFIESLNTPKNYLYRSIPLIGKEYDIKLMDGIIKSYISDIEDVFAVIEDVHAIFGSSANATFDFGFGCGIWEGILTANKIPYTKIQPKKWQAEMFEGIPKQTKPSSTGKTIKADTKKMAEMAAKRLFPNIDLRASERSVKSHDGKVDALLICEYCRRHF